MHIFYSYTSFFFAGPEVPDMLVTGEKQGFLCFTNPFFKACFAAYTISTVLSLIQHHWCSFSHIGNSLSYYRQAYPWHRRAMEKIKNNQTKKRIEKTRVE